MINRLPMDVHQVYIFKQMNKPLYNVYKLTPSLISTTNMSLKEYVRYLRIYLRNNKTRVILISIKYNGGKYKKIKIGLNT
jgi:hypothetical protein